VEKIKYFIKSEKGKDILIIIIIILVGLSSFELGRLSKANNSNNNGIKIEYPANYEVKTNLSQTNSNTSINTAKTTQTSGNYFASKRGKKYYPVGCSAGNTIKQENKIYFSTGAEAEKAGYELSGSCI
jgi:hypothetical protein